jgi:maltose alpha-D-glucosyltransferase/alpha-amylase
LLPMASVWAHYMSGFFIGGYKEKTKGSSLIPQDPEDFEMMLQNYIIQKALHVFNDYLRNSPQCLIIPQTILRSILRPAVTPSTPTPVATAAPVPAAGISDLRPVP